MVFVLTEEQVYNKWLKNNPIYLSDKFLHNLDHMLVQLRKKQAGGVWLFYRHGKPIWDSILENQKPLLL